MNGPLVFPDPRGVWLPTPPIGPVFPELYRPLPDMNTFRALLIALLSLSYFASPAQTLDYKYQVVFVYNIAKYTQWEPAHAEGDFTIGVLGSQEVAATFEQNLQGKKIGYQTVKVVHYTAAADIQYCHILFVPVSTKVDLNQLLAAWGNKNVMICTERDGWGRRGSTVNFITVDGKIKFEVNNASLNRSGLKMATSITSLAINL